MPRNGSGQYDLPYNWNDDKANGIKVLASRMQNQDQDIANALTGSLSSDGQTPLTGDLDFNGNKCVDLADGSDPADSVNVSQVQTGEFQFFGVSTTTPAGTDGEDYDLGPTPSISVYPDYARFSFVCHFTCIDNPNMRFGILATKTLKKSDGASGYTALEAGDMVADKEYVGVLNTDISATDIIIENPEDQDVSLQSGDIQTKTIVSGVVTIDAKHSNYSIDTEASAATDNLDTINGGEDGQVIILGIVNASRDVVITNSGNIVTTNGLSVTLDVLKDRITLIYRSSVNSWFVLAQSIANDYKMYAKAWVSFNGSSANPITPSASFNTGATVTKNSTGNYTITFDTPFSSANYCVIVNPKQTTTTAGLSRQISKLAGSYRFLTTDTSNNATDQQAIDVIFFGDQV